MNYNKSTFKKSIKINEFLNDKQSNDTRLKYSQILDDFFKFINEDPEGYISENFFFIRDHEEKNKLIHKYRKDIKSYKIHKLNNPNNNKTSFQGSSLRLFFSCLKSFFEYHEIEIGNQYWKKINSFKTSRSSFRTALTPNLLQKILDHTDLQGKCIFLICATSGSRITSVLSLRRKDIDMDYQFPHIRFYPNRVKNNEQKTKFVTPETKHYLESYFTRYNFHPNDYIFSSNFKKSKNPFMTKQNANIKFINALQHSKNEEINEHTRQRTITMQSLKSYFKSNFKCSDIQFINYMCEHSSQLDKIYYNKPIEELEKLYCEGYKHLLVYELPHDTDEVIKLKKENNEIKGKLKLVLDRVDILEIQNKTLFEKDNYLFNIKKQLEKGIDENTLLNQIAADTKKFGTLSINKFGASYKKKKIESLKKRGLPAFIDPKNPDHVKWFFDYIKENY